MKIKLQDYSLISNKWIDEKIKFEQKLTSENDMNTWSITRLALLQELKQELIPSEKLADEIYDELIGCSSHVLSEKVLYDQRKQDFLTSEIELL